MASIDAWIDFFDKGAPEVRQRAAEGLLDRADEVPIAILIEILDDMHNLALGAVTARVHRQRREPELLLAMVERLTHASRFMRETACAVLGALGERAATPALLVTLQDQELWVRHAAAFALAQLADPRAASECCA